MPPGLYSFHAPFVVAFLVFTLLFVLAHVRSDRS